MGLCGLTLDVRGVPLAGRPLDGGVSRLAGDAHAFALLYWIELRVPRRSDTILRDDHKRSESTIGDPDLAFTDVQAYKYYRLRHRQLSAQLAMDFNEKLGLAKVFDQDFPEKNFARCAGANYILPVSLGLGEGGKVLTHQLVNAARIHETANVMYPAEPAG